MKKNSPSVLTVEMYIAGQPELHQKTLRDLQKIIRDTAPKATELISYMIPAYKTSHLLVGFGATKKHCSFYSMNPKLLSVMKEELSAQNFSGSTIHFEPGKELPVRLLKKIIRIRLKQNEELYSRRKK